MRTTVNLPDALLARAKREAEREGTTFSGLLEGALRARLMRSPATPEEKPFRLVTFGSGGLVPGQSFERLKDLTEDEDIGRLDRARVGRAADGDGDASS
jgi:hypothetical protein